MHFGIENSSHKAVNKTKPCVLQSVLLAISASVMFMDSLFAAGLPIRFQSPMGEENWRMSGNPIRCGLSLSIPNYGIGYFEQYATQPPHFILRKWDQVQRPLPARLAVISPVWKPHGPAFFVSNLSINPGKFGIYLGREPALKLLTYLSQGYQANFSYKSEEDFLVSIVLSPIHFQKMYAKYQRCIGGLLNYNYESVKETVFHFAVDSKELSDEDKQKLRRIARFAEADPEIERIKIYGYADESGRKGYNNAISEFRAKAVHKYLLKIGVPNSLMKVTWLGELKPVGRNDTDDGRAANRRVVVNLIRK